MSILHYSCSLSINYNNSKSIVEVFEFWAVVRFSGISQCRCLCLHSVREVNIRFYDNLYLRRNKRGNYTFIAKLPNVLVCWCTSFKLTVISGANENEIRDYTFHFNLIYDILKNCYIINVTEFNSSRLELNKNSLYFNNLSSFPMTR